MPTDNNILPSAVLHAACETNQIIAVRCTGGSNASLAYYQKDSSGVWERQLTCPAFIGKAGAGKEREGDMKTPLGTFDLTTPFGILENPAKDDEQRRSLPNYLQLNEHHYWCGQSGPFYNRLIDNRTPPEGYSPSPADEHMIDYRPSYHYGMFIGYNREGIPHLGSAIFLHCIGKNPYTAGCVAVEQDVMKKLVLDLREGTKIVIFK